jgi:hypothetical protein
MTNLGETVREKHFAEDAEMPVGPIAPDIVAAVKRHSRS